jgi:phosphatidylinositol alpha-1,6-mannosyltransferase
VSSRTLLVTNDFPPRTGGIQGYLYGLAARQPAGSIVVYAPAWAGAADFDAAASFPVVRHPGRLMLPVPAVGRRARDIARAEGCTTVWFGAAAPLGLLAGGLRAAGVTRMVASTHGHEVGWAVLPAARQALRRIGERVDVVTYLTDYTRARIGPAVGPHPELVRLPSGVDVAQFHPDPQAGAVIRARYGLADRPVVVCVSRLVARKGQDMLIRALPALRARVAGTALVCVGDGPDRARLVRLARECGVERDVVFTGAVPPADLAAHYAAGSVFAMPSRTRRGGVEVEGLGLVYLEAAACGLPVVAGASGGAPDTVREGETGYVVDGRGLARLTRVLGDLLADPAAAAEMGRRGRAWMSAEWGWDRRADQLGRLLAAPGEE